MGVGCDGSSILRVAFHDTIEVGGWAGRQGQVAVGMFKLGRAVVVGVKV